MVLKGKIKILLFYFIFRSCLWGVGFWDWVLNLKIQKMNATRILHITFEDRHEPLGKKLGDYLTLTELETSYRLLSLS